MCIVHVEDVLSINTGRDDHLFHIILYTIVSCFKVSFEFKRYVMNICKLFSFSQCAEELNSKNQLGPS